MPSLKLSGVAGPVKAIAKLVRLDGIEVNRWWNGGTSFVEDGTLVASSGNTIDCAKDSMGNWNAAPPAGLPPGYYEYHYYDGDPVLPVMTNWLGYADWVVEIMPPASQPVEFTGSQAVVTATNSGKAVTGLVLDMAPATTVADATISVLQTNVSAEIEIQDDYGALLALAKQLTITGTANWDGVYPITAVQVTDGPVTIIIIPSAQGHDSETVPNLSWGGNSFAKKLSDLSDVSAYVTIDEIGGGDYRVSYDAVTYGDAVIQVDFGPSITADGERYKTVVMRSALTDASIQADIAKYIGQMYANPNRNPFAATDANGNVFLSIDLTDIQHPTYYSAAAAQYAYYSSGAYHLGPDLSTGNAIDSIVSPTILTTWNNGSVFTAYPLPTDSAAATAAAIAAASLATSAQVAGITEWAIYANVTQSSNVAGNAKFIGTGQGPGVCAGNIFGNAVFTNGSSIAPAGSISEDALFDATSVNMDGAVWGNAVLIGPASGTPIAHTGAFNSNVYTTGLVDLSQATITGSLYYWGSMTPAGPLGIGANGVDDYRLRRIGTTWYLWSAAVGGYAESQSLVGHYVGFVDNSFTGGFDVSGSGDSYTISNWTLLDGNGNPVVPPANPIIFQIKAATQLTAWPLALVKEMFVPAMQSFATPGRSIATDSHGNVIADVMLSDEQISIIAYEIASQTQIDPQTIRNAMAKALTASVESGSIDAKLNDKTGFSLASTGLDAISATSPTAKAITFKDKLLQVWDRLCGRVVHDKAAKTVQLTSDDGHTVRTTQSWTESTSNEIQGPMS